MKLNNIFRLNPKNIQAHDGEGLIQFQRLFYKNDLPNEASINFIDVAVLPPNTSIGLHKHKKTTEVYLIVEGEGKYFMNDKWIKVEKGDVLINHLGQHSLKNDSNSNLKIFVIETKTNNND